MINDKKRLKVACVGAGYFAGFHVAAWQRMPEVELAIICDLNIDKAKRLADEFKVTRVTDQVRSIAENSEIDIVDIITPPENHFELCTLFSTHAKHIICQKPLAPNLEIAKELVAQVEKGTGRFMVHENFRFQPWYRKIKQLLDEGVIGAKLHTVNLTMRMGDGWGVDAYLDRQPYFRTMDHLLIYETGIHYIDVFRFLFGEITSVYAKLRTLNPVIRGEDAALVVFDFARGGLGVLDGNRYNEANYDDPRYTFGETIIEGDQGTIRLYGSGKITVQKIGAREQEVDYRHNRTDFAGDCVYFTQRHFIERLLDGQPFETGGSEYLNNLIVQEVIYQSHREQKMIFI